MYRCNISYRRVRRPSRTHRRGSRAGQTGGLTHYTHRRGTRHGRALCDTKISSVGTSFAVFALLVLAGGAGAFAGSVLGNAFGRTALFAGALIGGALASAAAAFLSATFKWIHTAERMPTAIGAVVGFLVAAGIAVNTLSSPIGPVTSALLIGIGGLLGRRWARQRIA
jgi:hypothetical protein